MAFPRRPLIFVAHPDDETLACGGLLQRVGKSLVVFATDGAAPGFGCERQSGSLKAYSDLRFQEASRALAHIPTAPFQRLTKPDGSYFIEVHLFEELPAAATALSAIVRSFCPDAIISHAYEGAHIDHDACGFVAMHVGTALGLDFYEFPLYWLDPEGKPVLQRFRGDGNEVIQWQLSEAEIQVKKQMMAPTTHNAEQCPLSIPPASECVGPAAVRHTQSPNVVTICFRSGARVSITPSITASPPKCC